MKRLTLVLIQLLVACYIPVSTLRIEIVKAGEAICITADGTVDPPTVPIQRNGNVYTFTANITCDANGIVIERSHIIIDGVGYTLQGIESYDSKAIYLSNISNVTIENTSIKGFKDGVHVTDSSHINISGNNITNNYWGVWIHSSFDTVISGNEVVNNRDGIYLSNSHNNVISGNSIANKDYGVCLSVSSGNIISANRMTNNYHAIDFCESPSNNTVSGNDITNNSIGIYFTDLANNNIISGNNLTKNRSAIYLYLSPFNNTFSRNNLISNYYGICLQKCSNNRFSGNKLNSNRYNFDVKGHETSHFLHIVDNSNLLDGRPVYYWVNRHEELISLEAGYVALVNCTGIVVRNLVLTNNTQGLLLAFTHNSQVTNNVITNNYEGVRLYSSSGNEIFGNIIAKNDLGVWLMESSNNTFYHNNFVDNRRRAQHIVSANFWDNGYPVGGNYWSDYTGVDADGDGIGDTAYAIEGIIDRYPLMEPTNGIEFPSKEENPMWTQWWLWAIIIVVAAILIISSISLMKQKKTKTKNVFSKRSSHAR